MNKKINIQKLIKKQKKKIFSFNSKGWSVTVFLLMAVFAAIGFIAIFGLRQLKNVI